MNKQNVPTRNIVNEIKIIQEDWKGATLSNEGRRNKSGTKERMKLWFKQAKNNEGT